MRSIREKILRQMPYGGVPPVEPHPETGEIEALLAELCQTGIRDKDDARIAGFAWYSGINPTAVVGLYRAVGTAAILRRELGLHENTSASTRSLLGSQALMHIDEFSLAKRFGQPEFGWAIAVLKVAEDVDFASIIDCLDSKNDPARIASYYLACHPFIAPRFRIALTAKLLDIGDTLSLELAICLITHWLEWAITQGREPIADLIDSLNECGGSVIILGSLLQVPRKYQTVRFRAEVVARAIAIQELIDSRGKQMHFKPSDIRAILKRAGNRDLNVLAAMSKWRQDPAFLKTSANSIERTSRELLEREFASHLKWKAEMISNSRSAAPWVIEPLAEVLKPEGIESDIFEHYFDGLATDMFSQMTRSLLFLQDRQRAIILIAVAGLVAVSRGDNHLRASVGGKTEWLRSQPPGEVEVINAVEKENLEKQIGISIPSK